MTLRGEIASQEAVIARLRARLDIAEGSRSSGAWIHRDRWYRVGKNFRVEVEHATEEPLPSGCFRGEGPHRWFVYAYIYPPHPRFKTFTGNDISQDATRELELHGGCTFFRRLHDVDGAPLSIKVGADYHHAWDEPYTHAADPGTSGVLSDAQCLFDDLSRESVVAPVMAVVGSEPRDDMGAEVQS